METQLLRARMNEQDMNQRLQHFQQQRQGINTIHPPVSYGAPSATPSEMHYNPSHNPHSSLDYDHNLPTDFQFQPSLVANNIENGSTLPRSSDTRGEMDRSVQTSRKRTAQSPVRSRQRVTCIQPHIPNQLEFAKHQNPTKMIGARILSVTVPIVDYNVDENINVLLVSMNFLDANAGRWQSVNLPIGNYQSRRQLLNSLVKALSKSFPSVQFNYEYDKHGDGRCSIESVVIREDENEHGCHALYFDASNPRLLALLGIHVDPVQKFVEPQDEWDDEEDDGYQLIKVHHCLIVGEYPMNLLLPTHLDLKIPELDAYIMIPLQKARHGKHLFFEPIDEDGVVDLAHCNLAFGGCVGLTQLTPQLTYPQGSEYNCRNMHIALHVEFLMETHNL